MGDLLVAHVGSAVKGQVLQVVLVHFAHQVLAEDQREEARHETDGTVDQRGRHGHHQQVAKADCSKEEKKRESVCVKMAERESTHGDTHTHTYTHKHHTTHTHARKQRRKNETEKAAQVSGHQRLGGAAHDVGDADGQEGARHQEAPQTDHQTGLATEEPREEELSEKERTGRKR